MENITISENTPFRLIVRKGTNSERLSCLLAEGELGYTTDTNRLYIGDGATLGGNLIGNKFYQLSSYDDTSSLDLTENDLIYIDDIKSFWIYKFNKLNKLNLNNNIVIDENILLENSRGITVKPNYDYTYQVGRITNIKTDSYGRVINVNTQYNNIPVLNYYNITIKGNVGDINVYRNNELIYNYNIDDNSESNINNAKTWFTCNYNNTILSSISAFEWIPFLQDRYSTIQSQLSSWVGSALQPTNLIIQPNVENMISSLSISSIWNQSNNRDTFAVNNKAINFRAYDVDTPLTVETFSPTSSADWVILQPNGYFIFNEDGSISRYFNGYSNILYNNYNFVWNNNNWHIIEFDVENYSDTDNYSWFLPKFNRGAGYINECRVLQRRNNEKSTNTNPIVYTYGIKITSNGHYSYAIKVLTKRDGSALTSDNIIYPTFCLGSVDNLNTSNITIKNFKIIKIK